MRYAALDAYCQLEIYETMRARVADAELFTKMIDQCAHRFCYGYQSNRERNLTIELHRQMPPSATDDANSSKLDGDKASTTTGGGGGAVNAHTRHRAGRRQKTRGSGGGRTLTQGALIEYIREQEIWAREARARDCTGARTPFANVNTYKFVVDVMLAGLAKCMRRVGIDYRHHAGRDKRCTHSHFDWQQVIEWSRLAFVTSDNAVCMPGEVVKGNVMDQLVWVCTHYHIVLTEDDLLSRCVVSFFFHRTDKVYGKILPHWLQPCNISEFVRVPAVYMRVMWNAVMAPCDSRAPRLYQAHENLRMLLHEGQSTAVCTYDNVVRSYQASSTGGPGGSGWRVPFDERYDIDLLHAVLYRRAGGHAKTGPSDREDRYAHDCSGAQNVITVLRDSARSTCRTLAACRSSSVSWQRAVRSWCACAV
ncbi:unnamed protein product [Sphagnum balticum]